PLDGHVQQSLGATGFEQANGSFLECREAGNHARFDRRSHRRRVLQNSLQLAIVQAEKLFEHQAREQLGLRELFGATWMGVIAQRPPPYLKSFLQNAQGRFTASPAPASIPNPAAAGE